MHLTLNEHNDDDDDENRIALPVRMLVGLFVRPFVPLKQMSRS